MTVHLDDDQLARILAAGEDPTLAGGRLQCLACASEIVWPGQWRTMSEVYLHVPTQGRVQIARIHATCDPPTSWTDDPDDPTLPDWWHANGPRRHQRE